MPMPQLDVVVTAATPAGIAAATILAKQGHRVRLYDAGTFEPPPVTDWIPVTHDDVLAALGLLEQMGPATDVKGLGPSYAIRRGPFDRLLLDNARKHGVEVFVGVHVLDILFEGDKAVGINVIDTDCGADEVQAKVVVDATGPKPVLAKRQPILRERPAGKPLSWSYWQGVVNPNKNARVILLPEGQACMTMPSGTTQEPTGGAIIGERYSSDGIGWEITPRSGHGWLALWGAYGAYEAIVMPGVGRGLLAGLKAAQAVEAALQFGDVPATALAHFDTGAGGITLFDALERGCT